MLNLQLGHWPFHDEDELAAVQKVLKSGRTNYWTGEECREFEKEFAEAIGTTYSIALMNGTVALEAALYALEIGPGDEVITSSRTFIASASCVVMRGAKPIIADVDLDSQNITPRTIEPCITDRTKAIIVVHLAGWPADMEGILRLAKKYNLKVIEDCAQAHGAKIKGRNVGAWGDIGAFSFCQDKIMTTGGEGGMITTSDQTLWEKIWTFKDHGKNYSKVYQKDHPPGFRWLHDSFGTNFRMTEVQAAIGRLQLKKLTEWLSLRKRNAKILTDKLSTCKNVRIPKIPLDIEHAHYKYYIFIREENLKPSWNRDRILQEITERGVPCFTGSCGEIYLEKAFAGFYDKIPQHPQAKKLGQTSLMFLIHPTLTENDMQKIASVAYEVLALASTVKTEKVKEIH